MPPEVAESAANVNQRKTGAGQALEKNRRAGGVVAV